MLIINLANKRAQFKLLVTEITKHPLLKHPCYFLWKKYVFEPEIVQRVKCAKQANDISRKKQNCKKSCDMCYLEERPAR